MKKVYILAILVAAVVLLGCAQQAEQQEETKKVKIELWWTPTHYGDTEKDLAQVLKEQLEATGMIEVELKSAEWSTYTDYARKGMMMASLFGWYPDYLDPDDYTTPFLKCTANNWLGYPYCDEEMDQLLEQASVATSMEEREQLYKQIQQKLAEDAPIIPLVQGKLTIVAKDDVKGITLDPTMIFRYYLVYSEEQKDTITIGVTDKITELDPANAYDFYTWEIMNNIMGGLVRYKPGTTELEPYLAESWEVSDDGLVYTFKLRENLKFADGTPCKAQDVVRSIKRVMKIQGDPSWLVTDFVEDVEAVDDYTVKFTLKKPTAYFISLLATPPYFPVHPDYNPDEIDPDQTAGGVGPYKIVDWKRDQELILEANPNFFGDQPMTKRIVIKFYKDATTLRLAIEKGEVDIAWRTLTPIDIESLKEKEGLQVIEAPGGFIRYLVLNANEDTDYPTKNIYVRKAIAAAIDREDIAQRVYRGTVEPLYSLVPIGMWSHEDVFKEMYGDGNIELAKEYLNKYFEEVESSK